MSKFKVTDDNNIEIKPNIKTMLAIEEVFGCGFLEVFNKFSEPEKVKLTDLYQLIQTIFLNDNRKLETVDIEAFLQGGLVNIIESVSNYFSEFVGKTTNGEKKN